MEKLTVTQVAEIGFGSLWMMAKKLEVKHQLVYQWRTRGTIPRKYAKKIPKLSRYKVKAEQIPLARLGRPAAKTNQPEGEPDERRPRKR